MSFADIVWAVDDFLWGDVFIVFTILVGLYFTFRSKFFSFTKLGYIFRRTIFGKKQKDAQKGSLTPLASMCVALGSCIGTGNISGVAAAIAVGGPGAVFWLWVYGVFGMTIKVVEVALACYYRQRTPDGEFIGGPMYYIEKGLVKERKWKPLIVLAYMFCVFFTLQWFVGTSLYAAAESAQVCFNLNPLIFIAIYGIFVIVVTRKGTSSVGKFANVAVPIMSILYIIGGLVMIIMNAANLPGAFGLIFKGAFSGTAVTGAFAGAGVKLAMQKGLSRAINSNEAGQGSSPMIHAVADTRHPIEQGLWGAVEVFLDTIIVCSITALAILSTGVWSSGETSATLTITAFQSAFGNFGVIFMGVIVTIFAFTSTTGWFTCDATCFSFLMRGNEKLRSGFIKVLKVIYFVPTVLFAALMFYTNAGANIFWDVIDAVVALPTYVNLLSIFLLSGTFFKLMKDYKARYMGIGKIDPEFKYFYETEPNEEAKAHDAELMKEFAE